MERSPDGQASLARFFDALACNWLLAAPDAHAKNYSVLLSGQGSVLAPLYDVCSMAPYMRSTQSVEDIALAMRIGGAWTVGEADSPAAWRECAEEIGLDPRSALERVEKLAQAIPEALSKTLDEMPETVTASPKVAAMAELVGERAARRRNRLAERTAQTVPQETGEPKARRRRGRTRCPHTGHRSGRRCIRFYKHLGPHRYR